MLSCFKEVWSFKKPAHWQMLLMKIKYPNQIAISIINIKLYIHHCTICMLKSGIWLWDTPQLRKLDENVVIRCRVISTPKAVSHSAGSTRALLPLKELQCGGAAVTGHLEAITLPAVRRGFGGGQETLAPPLAALSQELCWATLATVRPGT